MHITNRGLPCWLCDKLSLPCPDQGGPQSCKHRKMSIRADGPLHVHSLGLSTLYPLEPIWPVGTSRALGSPEQIWALLEEKSQPSLQVCVLLPCFSRVREAEERGHAHLWSIITIGVKWLLCAGVYVWSKWWLQEASSLLKKTGRLPQY